MLLMYALEREWGFRFEASGRITYDRVDLIVPERREELLADLCERTGLAVTRAEIGRVNLLRDSAEIKVYYAAARDAHTFNSDADIAYDALDE